ncbi:MAG: transcription-repair coupling factor, partial [Bacteroidota bacterium]
MTIQELLDKYVSLEISRKIEENSRPDKSKSSLRGLVGSSSAIMAAAHTKLTGRPVLFILKDREQSVYFLNDLQNILGIPVDADNIPAPSDQSEVRTKTFFFPRTARVPYQTEDTDNMNVAMRAEVLNELSKGICRPLIVTHAEALFEKVITISDLKRSTFEIQPGNQLSHEFIDEIFHEFHFEKVDYVYEPGQYAVRGGILDVFSYSHDHPYRIEFFGDEVDSIRTFDPVTQLSVNKAIKATVVPDVSKSETLEKRVSLIEFLPEDVAIWISDVDGCMSVLSTEFQRAMDKFSKLDGIMRHSPPEELYLDDKTFQKDLLYSRLVEFGITGKFPEAAAFRFDMTPQPSFNKNFDMLSTNLANNDKNGYLNILAAGQAKQIERLYQIFEDKDHEIHAKPLLIELSEGFIDKENKILCYTDHQIFERFHKFRLKEGFKKGKEALTLKELMALQPGDYVVHIDHGVGQFAGLQKIDVNGKEQEAIRLTYKGGDILYVSIHSLHRISKYVGKDGTAPSVDKLGSNAWQNLKRKTKAKVKELAFDLLKLYAKRRAMKGFSFSPDTYLQTELEASFMYEDTPDQLKATVAVKEDMEAQYPMDRLVCGDVGFGKTEIAMRAAFKAVADSKQVAVLVPTTILSMQHYRSFSARFKDFPCKVDYINRFKSAGKQAETLKALEKGEIDIIIGTHGLVGKKVKFKNLGLLIIDEEQKFGVAVKDKLKTLRENVDTLTLTATPIPRTLQFSLMGARDMSIIQTPPPNRVPIETTLTTFNEEVIRDAVSFEISRGGQVFFVNNRIQNLQEIAGMIQRLCPDVRIGIVHGQMEGDKLEEVMEAFIEGTYDVLVSTAIVESGIDIGNA